MYVFLINGISIIQNQFGNHVLKRKYLLFMQVRLQRMVMVNGFNDDESQLLILRPLNPYGESKHNFDLWALGEKQKPPFWTGLKFFNVYGPNEYHKGKMASMVFHAYNQIMQFGQLSLFKSYKDGFSDGNQLRDFIYIKDILDICLWLCKTKENSGIINIGTGISSSFNQLGEAVLRHLKCQ